MRTGAAAGVLLCSGVLLTACSSSPAAKPGAHAAPSRTPGASTPAPRQAPGGTCTIWLYGHATRAEVTGNGSLDPSDLCGGLAKSFSRGGDFWTTQASSTQGVVPVVCGVQKDGVVIVVRDSSSQIYGQSVCSALVQGGWTEDAAAEQAGQQQDQATNEANARASAQASALREAENALATLQGTNRSFTNAKTVRDDVTTTDADLAKEREDAKGGNGDGCYNVENVVGYDAENVVGYDVTSNASYDVDQEQQNIDGVRTQISTLQQALTALTAAGLPSVPGAGAAIATAQANNATAIATTNKAVDHLNGVLKTAYNIANTLGTGDCADSGPGETPDSLSHIS